MVKYCHNDHKENQDPPNYKFEVISSQMTAISRQLREGLAIEEADPNTLINGKGEYGSNWIPRFKLTIKVEIPGTNPRNSDQPQIPTESSSNTHKTNTDTNSGDLFLEQFRQRKRQKWAATVSTENCEILSHMSTQPF